MIAEEERFQIISNILISKEHYSILYNLYQPIIGTQALSLYFTLINEWELLKRINLDVSHLRMTKLLKCSLSELQKARNLLEAVGLLDVYVNETQKVKYCYELHLPLSFEQFSQHNLYNEMLSSALGVNDYERTKFVLAKKRCDLSKYNKSTKTFIEVFQTSQLDVVSTEESIDHSLVSEENNWLVNDAVYERKLKDLKTYSVYQYLRMLKGFPLQDSDFQLLEKLLHGYQLKEEVVNCLLDFVYYKNNKLLVIPYLEKIATSLKQHNISDIYEAGKYLKSAYEHSKNKDQKSTTIINKPILDTNKVNAKTNNKYVSHWNHAVLPHWLRVDLKKKVNS